MALKACRRVWGRGAVWASTSPVAVDGESWTLLLWQLQEQGLQWETTISDGGKAIVEAVQTVAPEQPHRRDVWHVLQGCHKVQGRLDRLVEGLEKQAVTVARQAARLAAGKRLRGRRQCVEPDLDGRPVGGDHDRSRSVDGERR